MKKIVSFKKELLFKTKVSEITSISLEHKILKKDDDLVSGEFLINGEYKMTEGSINREKYEFILPFDIALNSNYDIESVNVDIDNFYYEVINNESLRVNIELLIEALEKELVREELEEIIPVDEKVTFEEELTDERNIVMENMKLDNIQEQINDIEQEDNTNIEINNTNINTNIFNVDSGETYSTYYVYVVKEEDTIDKILDKYSITKEELELYNDITNIKPFDKIVIPTNGR